MLGLVIGVQMCCGLFREDKSEGESQQPKREWPYWYCDYGFVHCEDDYLEPYSYVVLPQK